MEIYCIDYDGQEVTNPTLIQWDTGQDIYVNGLEFDSTIYDSPWFHFCNKLSNAVTRVQAVSTDNGATWGAQVPDALLQEPYAIMVYVYLPAAPNSGISKTAFVYELPVIARPRPDGVVIAESQYETLSISQLKAELQAYIDSKLT